MTTRFQTESKAQLIVMHSSSRTPESTPFAELFTAEYGAVQEDSSTGNQQMLASTN